MGITISSSSLRRGVAGTEGPAMAERGERKGLRLDRSQGEERERGEGVEGLNVRKKRRGLGFNLCTSAKLVVSHVHQDFSPEIGNLAYGGVFRIIHFPHLSF